MEHQGEQLLLEGWPGSGRRDEGGLSLSSSNWQLWVGKQLEIFFWGGASLGNCVLEEGGFVVVVV